MLSYTAENSFTFKGAGAVKTCPTQQKRYDERSEEFFERRFDWKI